MVVRLHYYNLALIGRKSPILSYCCDCTLESGEVVSVPLKNSLVHAAVLEECAQPNFEVKPIFERLFVCLTPLQQNLARFIASYYLCSLGQSLQLFVPIASSLAFLPQLAPTLKPLSIAQNRAFEAICDSSKALLLGQTGSGKTEVYFHLIAHALSRGKQALLLMPEISLTPQMEERLRHVFGDCVGIWHSKITQKKRNEIVQKIQNGEITILAGARSAMFLPLSRLGLVIVDEEHDDAYKSQSTPFYHARDLALWLCTQGIQTVLGSATPSASSYYKLRDNLYTLPRFFESASREITFVIGCDEPMPTTLDALQQTLERGEQAIFFLPTRANYKYIICTHCAHTLHCPQCDLTLSYHQKESKISCHHCHYSAPIPSHCPYCSNELVLRRIGTSELQTRLQEHFPAHTIGRLDKDSTSTSKKLRAILQDFNEGKIAVLIGTQMIAKGHDYHNVGLVVVLGIDYLLRSEDYRARERVIALLVQLCGRSGRKHKGHVIVQTGEAHFFSAYLHDYMRFLDDELTLRGADYPPLARLAMVHIEHKNLQDCAKIFNQTLHFLERNTHGVAILGAGQCPVERLANTWRFFVLLSHASAKALHTLLREFLRFASERKILATISVDIDPVSFT